MSSVRVLKTFIAVASEGSFAAAANRVALTQAAVGMQMRTLEADLRRPLFERRGKVVSLNAAGRELLPMVRKLVALYDQILAAPARRSRCPAPCIWALWCPRSALSSRPPSR